jgi:ATP-dependent DNA helicase RecG
VSRTAFLQGQARPVLAGWLPEPQFRQVGDQWVVTLWRDWLTPDFIAEHGLNGRQSKALELVRKSGRLTNLEYRVATGTIPKTAARDLDELVEKGILRREGRGRGVYYVRSGHYRDNQDIVVVPH